MVSSSSAWLWLRAELVRRLGEAEAAAVFAEFSLRQHQDYMNKRRAAAVRELPELERRLQQVSGAEARRLEKMIASRRSLVE